MDRKKRRRAPAGAGALHQRGHSPRHRDNTAPGKLGTVLPFDRPTRNRHSREERLFESILNAPDGYQTLADIVAGASTDQLLTAWLWKSGGRQAVETAVLWDRRALCRLFRILGLGRDRAS